MGFEQKGDDADNMRAGETVARQIFVSAVEPCGADINAGRGQFNNLAEFETEIQIVPLNVFAD